MTTKNMEARRVAFEAWAVARRFPVHRDGVVVAYSARCTDEAWQAWNAALNSICVELPVVMHIDRAEWYEKGQLESALTATGVAHK